MRVIVGYPPGRLLEPLDPMAEAVDLAMQGADPGLYVSRPACCPCGSSWRSGRPCRRGLDVSQAQQRGNEVMNFWRIIVTAAALAPLLVECASQPEGPAAEHGLCFQQINCAGPSTSGLPTKEQCKAAGGKSWVGGAANSCTFSL
jgi:hypothetical protein